MKKVNLLRLVTRGAVALILMLSLGLSLNAQPVVPDGVNYQAVVRDANTGNPLANTMVELEVDILDGAVVVNTEFFGPLMTNDFGLVNLVIGVGVDWGAIADPNIEVFVDAGSGFLSMGVTAIESVPYAAVAGNAAYYDGTDIVFGDGTMLYVAPDGTPGIVEANKTVVVDGIKDIYGFNNVGVDGAIYLGGNLDVANTGTVYVRNNEGATSINTGALRITGGLAAGNDSYFGQDVVIGGDLTVMGSIYGTFYGTGYGDWYGDFYGGDIEADNALLFGDLFVEGETFLMGAYVDGDLAVTGQGTFDGVFAISGVFEGLEVIYDAQIGDDLTVGGLGTFGSANVLGGLQVGGQTNVMDIWGENAYFVNLDVSGTASFGTLDLDYLNVNFDATVGGDLDVGGAGTFATVEADAGLFYDIEVDGLAEIMYLEAYSGEFEYLTVYGPTVLGDVTGEDAIFETMTVNDWLSVGSWGSFGGDLNVDGDGWFGGDMDVMGHGSFDGYGYFGEELDVVGVTTLQDDLHVWGIGYFENATPANSWNQGAVRITGGASIGHSLWIGADIHVQNDGYVGDDLYVNDGLSVGGIADMGDVVHIYSLNSSTCSDPDPYAFALEVDGGARIDLDLCVLGNTTLNTLEVNYAQVNFDLNVDGATTLGTLYVDETSVFNDNVTMNQRLDVLGATFLNTLYVNGISSFSDVATFNSDVYVIGETYLMDTWVDGDLTVTGTGTFGVVVADDIFAINAEFEYLDVIYDAWIGGDLDVDGDGIFVGDLYAFDGFFGGDLEAVNGTFSGDLSAVNGNFSGDVAGVNANFSNDGYFGGDLQVDGTITSGNSITIDGTNPAYGVISESNDELSFDDAHLYDIAALDVDGDGWFGGDLDVDGDVTVLGYTDMQDAEAENFTVNQDLTVLGSTDLQDLEVENLQVNQTANVDGATTLNSTLDVDGQADFHDAVNIDGATFIDNTLTVTDVATFNSFVDGDSFGGAVVVPNGGLHVGQSGYFGGSLMVAQNVTVGDNLTVQDASNLFGNVHIFDLDASINSSTGALVVDGGTGIGGDLNVGGVIRTGNTLALDGTYANGYAYSTIDDEGPENKIGFMMDDLVDINSLTAVTLNATTVNTVDLNATGHSVLNTLFVGGLSVFDADADFNYNVNVDGSVQVGTNLNVDGVTTLDQTTVDGIFTVNGATDLNGTLNVQDAATFQSTVNVQGNADFDANVNIDGNTTMVGNLDVDGITTLDNTEVEGTFDVIGNSTFTGTVLVTGNTTLNGTLGVTGNADFDADLNVDGVTTLDETTVDGTLDVTGNADFDANLNVDGITTLDETTVDGTLDVTGNADFDADVNVDGGLTVDGLTDLDDTQVVGTFDVTGLTTLDQTTIDGLATVNGDLDVNAAGAFTGKITAEGTIQSGLTLTLDGTYTLGSFSVIDDSNFDLIDFQGDDLQNIGAIAVGTVNAVDVNVSGDLDVDGMTTLDETEVGENLTVVMNTTIGNDLSVTGNTHLTGTLTVDGATTLNNTLDVSGIVHITNSTVSSDYTNGALVVNGGVGIGGDVNMNMNLNVKEELTVDGNALLKSNLTLQGILAMTKTDNISVLATGTPGINTVTGGIIQADGGGYVEKDWFIGGDLYNNGSASFGGRVEIFDATPATTSALGQGALWVAGGIATQNNVVAAGTLTSGASVVIDGTGPGTDGQIFATTASNSKINFTGTAVNVEGDFGVGPVALPLFTVAAATGDTWTAGTLTAEGNFTVGNPAVFTVDATNGDTWGNNDATFGNDVNAGNNVNALVDVNATTGNVNSVAGNVNAFVDVNAGGDVIAVGNVFSDAGAHLDRLGILGVTVGPSGAPQVPGVLAVNYVTGYAMGTFTGPAAFAVQGGAVIGENLGVAGDFEVQGSTFLGPLTVTSLTVNPGPVNFVFDGVAGNDFDVTGAVSTFDFDGIAAVVNGDLDVNANTTAPGNITAEGTITSGSSIVIDGTGTPGTIIDNTSGIDFTGTPVNVDGDLTVGAYGSNMFKVDAASGEVESYHTDGSLAVAFGPAAGQNDGWLKTYSKIGGGELVILGSNPAGTHGSVFVKDETIPATSYIGAGMYQSASGHWIMGVGDATAGDGPLLSWSGSIANEARIGVLLAGVTVFNVDAEGDFFGNDLALNGSFTLGGTTVTGITTAAWTSPGSVNNLVTEAAVEGFGDATYLRQDGTTPLTGNWPAGAFEISADGGVFQSLEAVASFQTSGAVYSHTTFVTAAYVVDAGASPDHIIITTSAAGIDLPTIDATQDGRILVIKNNAGAICPVNATGTDTIDDSGSIVDPLNMASGSNVTLIADLATGRWYVIAE